MSKKRIKQLSVLSLIVLFLTSCVRNTSLSDYCLIMRPEWVGSLEEAATYDCLCSENKIDKECNK